MNTDYMPAEVFPPGEFIREELEERGWTQEDLAEILGRPLRLVNEIIMAKRGITPETASGLGAALGTSPQFWMNLESIYRLSQVRSKDANTVERRARLYSIAPIKDMIKRHWIESSENIAVLEQRVLEFLHLDDMDKRPTFCSVARKSTPYLTDTPVQVAWLYRASEIAERAGANSYSSNTLSKAIEELQTLATAPEEVRRVPRLLADVGIRLVVVEPLRGGRLDGACFWLSERAPVIALSMRYDRIDYFWYTLMHELGHVKNQDGLANSNASIDTNIGEQTAVKPDYEQAADRFAAETLVPQDELDDFIQRVGPLYSVKLVRGFANRLGLHPGIVVGQLHPRKEVDWSALRQTLVPVRSFITGVALTDGWGSFIPSVN